MAHAQETMMIDYGHFYDDILYHGTISLANGETRGTWSFEVNGENKTADVEVSEETFNSLWNTISDSEFFPQYVVRGPDATIDPYNSHVIGVIFQFESQQGRVLFTIPSDTNNEEFLSWLEILDVPNQ